MTVLHLDHETKSKLDLTDYGLDLYCREPSTDVLFSSFAIDNEPVQQWRRDRGERMPSDLKEALRDPSVQISAFNAQFERWINAKVLDLEIDPLRYHCVMVAAYMRSFVGGLDAVGEQMGLPADKQKAKNGKKLIRMFCGPQKPTKNQPFVWRDSLTDPEEWEEFVAYGAQDVVAERDVDAKLARYEVPDEEWELYQIDQIINDRGFMVDRQFVISAIEIARRRKQELISEMKALTGVDNPNSVQQLLPWLKERGYPYSDLQKDSIKKTLAAEVESVKNDGVRSSAVRRGAGSETHDARINSIGQVIGDHEVTQEARSVMTMRLSASKTSTAKYDAALIALPEDDRLRHCLQFAGASRTNRWAGRRIQPHNLPRTPKYLEPEPGKCNFDRLDYVNTLIRECDYEGVRFFTHEPMDTVAGCVRSCIIAPEGEELIVCDLSSIETVVTGWLTGCERLLDVFREGRDAYKDFATSLYDVAYDEVDKGQRTICKPAVLGCTYRLSGGEMVEGKKTGLWGYAENMGVIMTREEAHKSVAVFRDTYDEVPKAWYKIEEAIIDCLRSGRKTKFGPLEFEIKKPFLRVRLPSGRFMYYYKARVEKIEAISRAGNPYTKWVISYMGVSQITKQWQRIESHGGKFIENFVQAIARDILAMGMRAAHEFGYYLVLHVHDELVAQQRKGDNRFTLERLIEIMSRRPDWAPDMPLGAAGFVDTRYRKD